MLTSLSFQITILSLRDWCSKVGTGIDIKKVYSGSLDTLFCMGMLAPKTREVLHGRAEVRQVYRITGVGLVAGCYILDGKVYRNDLLRIVRDGIIIGDDKMISLKRFKDDQKEVAQGYECGIGLEKFTDIKEGDIYETYIIEEYRD